jgi:hypothetical protein
MTTNTFTSSIYLCIEGFECERDVTVSYEFSRAGGDGWHEPRYPAGATLASVEVWYEGADKLERSMDILPLLPKKCISELECYCVQVEEDRKQEARDEAADYRRDEIPF